MMIQMCDICPSVSSEPLPVHTAHISDYRESPETGVVFEIEAPAGNVFSRVNISYTEGQERRCMLYKGTDVLRVLSAGFCLQGSVCRVLSAGFCLQGSVGRVLLMCLFMFSVLMTACLCADFYRGKTVFKHWLPGVCYRNITFQLISEATVLQTPLVSHSDITHTPLHHRTGEQHTVTSHTHLCTTGQVSSTQ